MTFDELSTEEIKEIIKKLLYKTESNKNIVNQQLNACKLHKTADAMIKANAICKSLYTSEEIIALIPHSRFARVKQFGIVNSFIFIFINKLPRKSSKNN